MRPTGKLQYTSGMFKVTFAGRFGARIDVRAELHLRLYEIASTIGLIPAPH